MKKKSLILILAVIILVIVGLWGLFYFEKQKTDQSIEQLIAINTTRTLNDQQKITLADIQTQLVKDPKDYKARFTLAQLKQQLLDYEGAIILYNQLRKENPEDILVLNNLGSLFYDTARYEESEQAWLDIIKITPKWINAYRELAEIYRWHLTDKKSHLEPILLTGLNEYPEMKSDFYGLLYSLYTDIVPNADKAKEYAGLLKTVGVTVSNQPSISIQTEKLK